MKISDKHLLMIGGAAAAAALAYLLYKKGKSLVTTTLNPTSDQNIAYTSTNSILQNLGIVDDNSSLGSQIYDWLHTPYNPNAPAGSPAATEKPRSITPSTGSTALDAASNFTNFM